MALKRRHFIAGGLAAGSLALLTSASDLQGSEHPELKRIKIPAFDLPPAFDGFRIGYISDVHLGYWVTNETVEDAVARVNREKPDLIILGGDYIWHHGKKIDRLFPDHPNHYFDQIAYEARPEAVFKTFADLASQLSAPHGTVATLGNHENWVNPGLCVQHLETRGIRCLVNREILIQRGDSTLRIYGIDDLWTGLPLLPKQLGHGPHDFRVLAAHNPDTFAELLSLPKPCFGVGLAGHTHGGQIRLPIIGALHHNTRDPRFNEGLFSDPQRGVSTYTSRGIGMVELPFRLNCPPEINLFELARS